MEAWMAGFGEQYPDVTATYDPIGSGGGREQFINGGTLFAGTDSALDDEEVPAAEERCGGEVIEIPTYISRIAVVYNLEGVDELQLSPQAIAGIFNQQITNWNDPAIAETNSGVTLPDLRITPVNRSDESGTTENLWNAVSDRLNKPGSSLSGGQQQRLCIARAIAVQPDVLLMDSPAPLDPVSTLAIEDLITQLTTSYTIVTVTHNMQQASRVSDVTGFFNIEGTGTPGKLVEQGATSKIFTNPEQKATEDYITGRFG